jgi:hypothetical protein
MREGWKRKARSKQMVIDNQSHHARTCSGQPDPQGHAQKSVILFYKLFLYY